MSQKIQVRRGTNAARTTFTADQGEPMWIVDTHEFYMGDGSTAGGIKIGVGLEGESYKAIMPNSGETSTQNASGFYLALRAAENKLPYGSGLSQHNRYSILLFPGVYDFTTLFATTVVLNNKRYIDIAGVGNKENVILKHNNSFNITSGYTNISNLSVDTSSASAVSLYLVNAPNTNLENVNIRTRSRDSVSFGSQIDSLKITNSNTISGGVNSEGLVGCNNSSFIDCYIDGDSFTNTANYSNNLFDGCFMKQSIPAVDDNGIFGNNDAGLINSTNLVKNCYLSGTNIFGNVNGGSSPFQGRVENCYINGNVQAFEGTMKNCEIDGRRFSTTPVTVTNLLTYPAFYNCTVLASGVVAVTGSAVTSSGFFSHSTFNKLIATGVTGLFGNQFNSIHASVK